MDHAEVGRYWDQNADTWTELVRAGYDIYRDLVNTPAFLAMLPDLSGRNGLDLGYGEGHNTRLLARRGAQMTAIDIAWRFLDAAVAEERRRPLGIRYLHSSAVALPFHDGAFDFVVAFMSLMDMPDLLTVLAEVHRVLRSGGFLPFSIEHPCTAPPGGGWVTDQHGRWVARAIGGYFEQQPQVDTWIFGAAPDALRRARRPFRIPRFPRTLGAWLNAIASAGLIVEAADEPYADEAAIARHPQLEGTRIAPLFLHLRCRKSTS
jgi:ubiquinone/menaquinone biosynthesis C-methylase UbiE